MLGRQIQDEQFARMGFHFIVNFYAQQPQIFRSSQNVRGLVSFESANCAE